MTLAPDHPYQDFRNFLYAAWMFLGLPEPTPVQYDIAYFLQHGPKRSVIQAYRGVGKSWITSIFAVWNWYLNPDCRIMVVSGSKDRADDFSRFCLRILTDWPEVQHLAPRKDQQASLMKFEVNGSTPSHSSSCKSVGITGQLTGSRADVIIADDIETPRNSMTLSMREKLETLVTEFDAILKPDPESRIVYLGTPQVEDSLYAKLPTKGYETRIWPARMPLRASAEEKYAGNLAPFVAASGLQDWEPVDPIRFDNRDLGEREASYGRTGFALQFMLDTSLEDELRFPLRCRDFIVMDVDREVAPVKVSYGSSPDQLVTDLDCAGLKGDRWFAPMYVSPDHAPYSGSVMFVDPSGRGKDKTGYAVVNHLNGMLYVRRAGAVEGGYDETALTSLSHIARGEKVRKILIESNFGDGMFTQLFKPVLNRIYPCTTEEVRHSKQKELRIIDTLEPVLNQHRLVIDRQVVQFDLTVEPKYSLSHQLTRVTKDRGSLAHDDTLDALAGAVNYWVEKLDLSIDDAEERHRRELKDAELDKWLDQMEGRHGNRTPNWTNTM